MVKINKKPTSFLARNPVIKFVAGAAVLSLAACYIWVRDRDNVTWQGWDDDERAAWYWGTQGSRLMPKAWFDALEVASAQDRFATLDNLGEFGFLAPPDQIDHIPGTEGLPIGISVDLQADDDFQVTRLRWYDGQTGAAITAEPWIGLNCSACHTGQMTYDGVTSVFDGAPNLLDFQNFVEDLDLALIATRAETDKFDRFAQLVLDGRDTAQNREMLANALDRLIAWQRQTEVMNFTDLRYGYGRLDAVGHILNKVLMFAGADAEAGNPANAPVSYPFIWGIHLQERVQWNGIAQNSRFEFPEDALEYGALGRNTGEVLGVFGEVILTPPKGPLDAIDGFTSSVRLSSLDSMEHQLQRLTAPVWPAHFPPIDEEKRKQGGELFKQKCASCHVEPPKDDVSGPVEKIVTFDETLSDNRADLTDIWMACNAFVYRGPTGPLAGHKDLDGKVIPAETQVAVMLGVSVRGAIIKEKADLVRIAFRNFLGIQELPQVDAVPETGVERAVDRSVCLNAKGVPTLGYKARPLDGIWATAPYLHNGSAASLYELLLPPNERAHEFWVGNRSFDPVRVGYVDAEPQDGRAFLLRTRDEDGVPIPGNSPEGHDYGVRNLTEAERFAIIEYLKSL